MVKCRTNVWMVRPIHRWCWTLPEIHDDKWAWFQCHVDRHRLAHKLVNDVNPKFFSISIECWCPDSLCPVCNWKFNIFFSLSRRRMLAFEKLTVIKRHSVPKCFEMLYCASFLKTVSFSTSNTYLASVVIRSMPEVQCGNRTPSVCSEQSITTSSAM